jgi:CpeT/CpcT family (DUF1001)
MLHPTTTLGLLFLGLATACASSTGVTAANDAATVEVDAASDAATDDPLATLRSDLVGDFDNSAQVAGGFSKRVERHVCVLPSRTGDASVVWLYVEQVEDLADGRRDAYFTRVNEIRLVDGQPVSRAYKLVASHPLASNAFAYNGPRDGCTKPALLAAIRDADLVYRDGCDITFTPAGDHFNASTKGTGCSFPGGYIQTTADVSHDELDTQDVAVAGGQSTGDKFRFRRVRGFVPPAADAGIIDAASD